MGKKKHTKQKNTTQEEMFAFKIVSIYCSLLYTVILIFLPEKGKNAHKINFVYICISFYPFL